MMIPTRFLGRVLVLVAMMAFFCCGVSRAAEVAGEEKALLEKYQSIIPKLENNQFNAPIVLESTEAKGTLRVDMYGTFNYPFHAVAEALQYPPNWCDITFLHLNTKACIWRKKGEQWTLTLYSGRKYYQPPSDGYPLRFNFRVLAQQPQYLDISLNADEGPVGTKDHHIRLQAVPLESGKTFVHFSYSYKYGAMAKMAVRSYFNSLGRGKVGFSQGGKVEGVRGALERNTVRYYLALQTFLETLKYPEPERFEQRISRWYDLTAKYPRQLKENEKSEYLANKKRERVNQVALQKKEK